MLAAAFRVADEIDNANSRITEPNRLMSESIDLLTKAHWLACYYIQRIEVATRDGAIEIVIHDRVPEAASSNEKEAIRYLLDEYRRKRMQEELFNIRDQLKPKDESRPCLTEVRFFNSPQKMNIENLPTDIMNYIDQSKKKVEISFTKPNNLNQITLNEDLSSVHDILLNCSNDYSSSDHIGLRTGWHSSRYFQCHQILQDTEFLRILVKGLADVYRRHSFTDIIGFGTSGISIGSQLALALGARFQFTFSSPANEIDAGLKNGYSIYEQKIEIHADSRILLIDDIVGMGSIVNESYKMIHQDETRLPSYTRFFCLLSLGRVKPEYFNHELDIDYLLDQPSVSYWREEEDGKCEDCRGKRDFLIREDSITMRRR